MMMMIIVKTLAIKRGEIIHNQSRHLTFEALISCGAFRTASSLFDFLQFLRGPLGGLETLIFLRG
jgi:hypothetical protein